MRTIAKLIPLLALMAVVVTGCNKEEAAPPASQAPTSSTLSTQAEPPIDSETKEAWREDEEKLVAAGFKVIPDSTEYDNGRRVKVDQASTSLYLKALGIKPIELLPATTAPAQSELLTVVFRHLKECGKESGPDFIATLRESGQLESEDAAQEALAQAMALYDAMDRSQLSDEELVRLIDQESHGQLGLLDFIKALATSGRWHPWRQSRLSKRRFPGLRRSTNARPKRASACHGRARFIPNKKVATDEHIC